MSKEIKYLCIFLLLIGILKFCFFTNTIIPFYDSYEFLLLAKNLWYSHSFLIDSGLGYKFTSFHEPGYALLIALFYPVFHDFEVSAAFVTVMASILSVFFIYLLMEKIKRGTGKFAAFLLVTSWFHLFCSSLILRDIPSLCFIIIILYSFYGRPLSSSRTILLGLLIAFASLIHLTNAALLFPFSYRLIKEKKIKKMLFLLGSYGLILLPYVCLRVCKWPFGTMDVQYYSKELRGYTLIYPYLKTIFLKFMHWEPSILIFGLTGVFLVLRKNTTRRWPGQFWGMYFLGYLFIFFLCALKFIDTTVFEDTYLIPFLPPFILAGSIYLNYLFNLKSVSTKAAWWANGIITCFILVLMTINHWALKDLFIHKLISAHGGIPLSGYQFIFFSLAFLTILGGLLILSCRYKKIFQKIIITGLMMAFSIQVFDEIIKIKGRHIMTSRGKELSSDINALKGKILPGQAFFVGVDDAMGILYHTGYPLFYEKINRLIGAPLGQKWNTKTLVRIINLSRVKPVICVYDHLYRYYLTDLGNELYQSIQEEYQDNLCFSNLKLNLKIYLLDNISTASDHGRFHAEAIDYYAARLGSKPDDISLLNYLGWAYFCSGDFDAAIKKWGEKEALTAKDADVHNNLGLAYYRKGDYQTAIGEYNKALEFKPVDDPQRERWARAMIYFNLAQAYEKAQEKEKAILTWEKYYETIPYPEHKTIMEKHIKRISE